MAEAAPELSGLQRSRVKVDHVEVSPSPQSVMDASAGTKCATAAALSFAFTAANQERVASSGVANDDFWTGAAVPGVLTGDIDEAGAGNAGPRLGAPAHEQTVQAAGTAATAASSPRAGWRFTRQVKHGRNLHGPARHSRPGFPAFGACRAHNCVYGL